MIKRLIIVMAVFLLGVMTTAAQTPTPQDPNAVILFPPPVYVLGGEADIVGTANVPGQTSYFIEYLPLDNNLRPLDGDLTPWLPATLPSRTPVTNDILGVWDTSVAPDGLYALRLTTYRQSGGPLSHVVMPIRVDNTTQGILPVLDENAEINNALLSLTATALAFSVPGFETATPAPSGNMGLLQPTPTAFSDGSLTAEVLVIANLREGDSTLFGIEAGLQPGTVLQVLGQSTRGNNWLFVEAPNGARGWVAPSVVRLSGDIFGAQRIEPPPIPITPTPTRPPLPDARITEVSVDREIEEDVAFQIIVTVRNDGASYLPRSVLFCNVEPMDTEVSTSFGDLQPGTGSRVALPIRVTSGGGSNITIICRIDMNEQIAEIDENNNTASVGVFLND